MFGWSRPCCPVDGAAKAWIDQRLQWLSGEFGIEVFTERPIVLPTPEFFPDAYDGSKRAVRAMLDRVCGYMDVAPRLVALKFFSERRNLWLVNEEGKYLPNGTAGLYEEGTRKFIIRLETSDLDNPMNLVGTMAHELAHVRLLGEGRVDADSYDNELLTDLTAVFHGFGIFLANSPRHWDGQYSRWPATELRKPEYMTLPMFGYALAHSAWIRDERWPSWAKYLRIDVRAELKQGLRYLRQTADSSFKPPLARSR